MLFLLLGCAPAPPFADIQADVFTPSCAFSSCHEGAGAASGLDLSEGNAYAEIVDVEAEDASGEILVVPGDHAGSYLWQKSAGGAGLTGDPMPLGSDALDAERLDQLAAWIDAGASG